MSKERDNYNMSSFLDPDLMPFAHLDMINRETFNGTDAIIKEISTVPEMAGFQPMPGGPEMSSQNILTDLMGIREEMPFIPIAQWPKSIRTIFLPIAGTAVDLDFPSGVVLAKFSSTADFYVSSEGRAELPGATSSVDQAGVLNPTFTWFYVGGLHQFSVVSPIAGAVVQMVGIAPRVWPQK